MQNSFLLLLQQERIIETKKKHKSWNKTSPLVLAILTAWCVTIWIYQHLTQLYICLCISIYSYLLLF